MTALSDKGTPQLPKSLTVHPIQPVSGVKDVAEAAMAAPVPLRTAWHTGEPLQAGVLVLLPPTCLALRCGSAHKFLVWS